MHINYKACTKCGKTKPIYDFPFIAGRGNHRASCKDCGAARNQNSEYRKIQRYFSNPREIKSFNMKTIEAVRREHGITD